MDGWTRENNNEVKQVFGGGWVMGSSPDFGEYVFVHGELEGDLHGTTTLDN